MKKIVIDVNEAGEIRHEAIGYAGAAGRGCMVDAEGLIRAIHALTGRPPDVKKKPEFYAAPAGAQKVRG